MSKCTFVFSFTCIIALCPCGNAADDAQSATKARIDRALEEIRAFTLQPETFTEDRRRIANLKSAIDILGEERAAQHVEILAQIMFFSPGDFDRRGVGVIDAFPALRALAQIGEPSLPVILRGCYSAEAITHRRAVGEALLSIVEYDTAKRLIEKEIASASRKEINRKRVVPNLRAIAGELDRLEGK